MARVAGLELVYEAAESFRRGCLLEGRSLLWPSSTAWGEANLSSMWSAFVEHPIEGTDLDFLGKWQQQLAGMPADVHRIAADLLTLYYLFPMNIGQKRKLDGVKTVAGWKLGGDPPDWTYLGQLFSKGVGSPGIQYLTAGWRQIEYYLHFSREVVKNKLDPFDLEACKLLADKTRQQVPASSASRNILLHLFFPDHFEGIASTGHKRLILEHFKDLSKGISDIDDAIFAIRGALTERYKRQDFDFYDADILPMWNPPQQNANTKHDWIFQSNPERSDLIEATRHSDHDVWSVSQHRDEIDVGDRVWFRVAGSNSGIYVQGTVTTKPYETAGDEFGKWKVGVLYDNYVEPPLRSQELRLDPTLAAFNPLYGVNGTNFQVPGTVAQKLLDMAGPRLKPIEASFGGGPGVLKGIFEDIMTTYPEARRTAPFSSEHPVWATFERFGQILGASSPVVSNPHLRVKPSVGQGNWAAIPWIAIMDDRETASTQNGLYCVYLFREDGGGVYLTLNQGVTEPRRQHGAAEGKRRLRIRAVQIRGDVNALAEFGFRLDDGIDLHTDSGLGADYENSTIAYKLYEKGLVPTDELLLEDLANVIDAYQVAIAVRPPTSLDAVYGSFSAALEVAHLTFGKDHGATVMSFLSSIVTKPLVILTGLTGSGKTQIALKFGEWLGRGNSLVIPVRPDWTGPEALFGYEDALRPPASDGSRVWFVPPALEFMLKAAHDPTNPYLLLLDEMNLAHVERYFSDFLSGMESAEPVLPNLIQLRGEWRINPDEANSLAIPRNLLVVGTVNVDETTYMFSPKVLDRANTLELRVSTEDLKADLVKPTRIAPAPRDVTRALLSVATDDAWQATHSSPGKGEIVASLVNLHRMLSPFGAEFGYRTFYEILRFSAIYAGMGDTDWQRALDLQVLQKVLPKLHGSRRKLESTLVALGYFCFHLISDEGSASSISGFDPLRPPSDQPRLSRSFTKVQRMLNTLRANQFVSFTE